MHLLKTALLLGAVLLSFNARAAFVSGNELHEWLSGDETSRSWGQIYVMGIADAHQAIVNQMPPKARKPYFCLVSGVEDQQLGDVVRQYLQKHPETRHRSAGRLVIGALVAAFPCK
jgi:hypothetical protein